MSNSVTNRQIFFILILTITTYTTIDLPKIMAQSAGRSSWIPVIITSILFGLIAIVITKLNNMFKGKVFFDYSQQIVGKLFAYIIAIYYILSNLFIGVYLKLKLVHMLTSNFLPKTSQAIMLLIAIALFAYTAYKGITNVSRMFEIIGILFIVITVSLCFFMLSQGMADNILPLYNPSETKQFLVAIKDLLVPYGGAEVLLVIPFTQINKKAPKAAFLTFVFIGLFYVIIMESTIMILGINNVLIYNDAFIEAIKIVEAPVIERVDIFYLTIGLVSLFAGMIIVFTALMEFTCKVFSKLSRRTIAIILYIIFFLLCFSALQIHNVMDLYKKLLPYPVFISSIIIPTIVFIVAKLRKSANQ